MIDMRMDGVWGSYQGCARLRAGSAGLALGLALAVGALFGCGGDGELSTDTVTSLPDGTATGTAHSGRYRLTVVTTSCGGSCPKFQYGPFVMTICDMDDKSSDTVTLTQQDGHLTVTDASSFYVSRLEGGINADGSFDVGGTELQSGVVRVNARARGSIDASGGITGEVKAHGNGEAEGQSINCTGTYALSGVKN